MEDMLLEAVVIPVADVDRAKAFYVGLGWRLDADFPFDNGFRVVQLTPPGSPCSVQFGTDITTAAPGSAEGLYLVVSDIEAAREGLLARGVDVSEVFHPDGPGAQFRADEAGRAPGPAPEHAQLQHLRHVPRPGRQSLADPADHDQAAGSGGRAADVVRVRRRPGSGAAPCGGRPRGARGPRRRQVRRELAGLVRRIHGRRAGWHRAAHLRQMCCGGRRPLPSLRRPTPSTRKEAAMSTHTAGLRCEAGS